MRTVHIVFVYQKVHVFFGVTRQDMTESVSKQTKTVPIWQRFGLEAEEKVSHCQADCG